MKPLFSYAIGFLVGSALANVAPAQDSLFTLEGDQAGELLGQFRAPFSVADGDGDGVRDLVVGAPGYDGPNGTDCGRVELLSGKTLAVLSTWYGEGASDQFGRSIEDLDDIDGDGVHDISIAANEYPGGADQGKVYIYSGATGALIYSWTGEKPGDGFQYPRGVGDATGDGVNDVLVSANRYSSGSTPTFEGKVYLYSGADGSLVNSWVGGVPLGLFGHRLGRLGFDVDGDGANDFAVGSFEQQSPPPNPGHVYIYSAKSQTPLVTISGANDADVQCFINDAADVDGDGIPDLLVGAPGFNGFQGVQYVYSGKDWSVLRTWYGTSTFGIGSGSSMAGDVDGDGFGDVLVGYPSFEGPAGADSGILELRSGATGRVLSTWYGGQTGEGLGFPSRNAGDLDGDGILDQFTTAIRFDGAAGADTGKIYAFRGNDLYFDVVPSVASAGDTVTLTTTAGVPGNLVIDVLTELDGVPMFLLLTSVLTFDSNGELVISGVVDASFGAHDLKLQSFAIGRSGKLIDSTVRSLTLQ